MIGEGGKLLLEALRIRNQEDEFFFAIKVIDAIDELLKLRDRLCSSRSNNCINDIEKFIKSGRGLNEFQSLNSHIVCEKEPPRDLAIMKFLYLTLAGEKLYEELYKFDDLSYQKFLQRIWFY